MKRSLALIAAIVLAAATATTSQARPAVPGTAAAAPVHLTYMDWYAPAYPNLAGVVGGDVSGEFGGAVLKATAPDTHGRFQTTAVYIVVASDASKSFTVRAHGTQDNLAGRTCQGGHCAGWRQGGARRPRGGRLADRAPRSRRLQGRELHPVPARHLLPGHHHDHVNVAGRRLRAVARRSARTWLVRDPEQDVGSLDDDGDLGSDRKAEVADGLDGDRRDDPHAAGVELDVRNRFALRDAGDPGGDLITRAELHAATLNEVRTPGV